MAVDVAIAADGAVVVEQGGALSFGDQHFGLAYGEYAWQGVNLVSTQLFGGDVRMTLGKALNCMALAHTIASKCVLGVCVGHEAQLDAICEGGLDAIVNEVHERIAAFRLDVFRFISGEAVLVDDDQDGVADRMTDGTWDAQMNLGMGLRKAPATFSAGRSVQEALKESIAALGENITLGRFERLETSDAGGLLISYLHPPGKLGVLVEFKTI